MKAFNLLQSRGGGAVGNLKSVRPASGRLGLRIRVATDLSLKQVVTAPLPNAWHKVSVSRVLGDDHYKRMSRVTGGVAP